jgi:parvulin-like peptidyl-prolyl isomerase
MMNKVIKVLCFSFVCMMCSAMSDGRTLHDKIAVVINRHVVTEGDIDEYIAVYAQLSHNQEHVNDSQFRTYITSLLVVQYMLEDFAERNQLSLTPEEEKAIITAFMEKQQSTYMNFMTYADDAGVDSDRLKQVLCGVSLQQKIGMAVIASSLEVTEDEIVHARHQYIDDHALYKIKSWIVGLESGESIDSVKTIKHQWAISGVDPVIGEVHDLGWKKRSELPDLFLKAIEGVSPGNLVGPVQSMFGYHLIWFEGEEMPVEPTEADIKEGILQQKYYVKFADWVKDLHQYNIVIYK